MNCIAAQYVYIGQGRLLKRHAIHFDKNGNANAIKPFEGEMASTIFINGIVCPSFVWPDKNISLTPAEATALLHRLWDKNRLLPVNDLLNFYTSSTELKLGSKPILWCIEKVDLLNLLFTDNFSVHAIFP